MKLISIFKAAGQLEAEIMKSFLESQGLKVILNQESVGRTYGLSAGKLGMVEVLVPEEEANEARGLIQAMNDGKFDVDDQSDLEIDSQDQETE